MPARAMPARVMIISDTKPRDACVMVDQDIRYGHKVWECLEK
jgi:hypothetical protein